MAVSPPSGGIGIRNIITLTILRIYTVSTIAEVAHLVDWKHKDSLISLLGIIIYTYICGITRAHKSNKSV